MPRARAARAGPPPPLLLASGGCILLACGGIRPWGGRMPHFSNFVAACVCMPPSMRFCIDRPSLGVIVGLGTPYPPFCRLRLGGGDV